MFEKVIEYFKKDIPVPSPVVYSDSRMYSGKDFPMYNPDSLIGRQGYGIYKKMMQDEQVKAVVRFKRDAITQRGFMFELDEDLPENELEFRIGLSEAYLANMRGSFVDGLNGILTGMWQGFSANEKVLKHIEYENKTWMGLDCIRVKPYESFYFYVDEYGELIKIEQRIGDEKKEVDPEVLIHYVQNPEIDHYYGESELRAAYRSWFSKDKVIKFWNIFLERHAGGLPVVTMEGNKTLATGTAEYNNLIGALDSLQTKSYLILPSGFKFDLHQPQNTEAYENALNWHDKAIAKALLVPNLLGISEQGDTGSYSQSQTQFKAFFWTVNAETQRLEEVLNEQLFRGLGEMNFGDRKYPKFRFKPVSKDELLEMVKVWGELVGKRAVTHTDEDEAFIRELLGIPPKPEIIEEEIEPEIKEPEVEEEKVGMSKVSRAQFTKALRRVDFAVIDRSSELLIDGGTKSLEENMGDLVKGLVNIVKRKNLGTAESTPQQIDNLTLPKGEKAKIRETIRGTLSQGWDLGQRHAAVEISKTGRVFTKNFALENLAASYLDAKAFQMSGNLTDRSLAIVKNILMQGLKYNKTLDQIETEIYQAFASEGLIGADDAKDALGEALGVENPSARLQTVIKTNSFEAINEARFNYFSDPQLDGFVEALEYSAILDSRTTAICQHLDGKVFELESEEWEKYRPPNHHNCRSLLIAVTQDDEWQQSNEPTVEPNKGFA